MMQLACFMVIIGFALMRNEYRTQDKNSTIAFNIQKILTVVSIIDMILVWAIPDSFYSYNWITALIRPWFILVSIRVLRDWMKGFLWVVIDSMPMVAFITAYITYFSWLG